MDFTRNLQNLNKNDAPIAGGKGASLGEMIQAGIPVPPGFVVLSTTFDQFLKEADLVQEIDAILDKVSHKEVHTVENASEQIQGLIKSVTMPESIADEIRKQFKDLDTEYVAVRSSATAEDGQEHAWAGQLDSYLNTIEATLLEKVQHCWASLFTPRAIFYRFEKGLHATQISVAVVIQKMVNSEVSGIAFSVHPVTEDRNQLIIEAGFGLGEAIVSGQITPDSYVVEKEPRRIIDVSVNTQTRGLYRAKNGGNKWRDLSEPQASSQVLDEVQILELSKIIIGIENHYRFPCDVEWAFEDGKFYIVQSRPITTLKIKEKIYNDTVNQTSTKLIVKYLPLIKNYTLWPPLMNFCPFVHSSLWNCRKFFDPYYKNKKKYDCINFIKRGESFYTLTAEKLIANSKEIFATYLKDHGVIRERHKILFGRIAEMDKLYNKLSYAFINKNKVDDLLPYIEKIWHILWDASASVQFAVHFEKDFCLEELRKNKFQISLEEFNEIWDKSLECTYNSFDKEQQLFFYNLIIKKVKWVEIIERCQYFYSGYDGAKSLTEVERELKKDYKDIKKISDAKNKLKSEERKLDGKIAEYSKWYGRLNEKQQIIVEYVQEIIHVRDVRKNFFAKGIVVNWRIAEKIFDDAGVPYEFIRYYTFQEIMKGVDYLKKHKQELMKREDGFALLVHYSGKTEMSIQNYSKSKEIIDDYYLKQEKDRQKDENILNGQTGSPGVAKGMVRIMLNISEASKFQNDEVLVAGMTRPEYASIMKKAVAIITDEGGITCHAAIVARELKIPCIIGTKLATKILKDGDLVEVDANNGVVRIIERAK